MSIELPFGSKPMSQPARLNNQKRAAISSLLREMHAEKPLETRKKAEIARTVEARLGFPVAAGSMDDCAMLAGIKLPKGPPRTKGVKHVPAQKDSSAIDAELAEKERRLAELNEQMIVLHRVIMKMNGYFSTIAEKCHASSEMLTEMSLVTREFLPEGQDANAPKAG